MKVQAIIPTAGQGKRFQSSVPKPLTYLLKKPIIIYSLETLCSSSLIDKIVLVVPQAYMKEYQDIVKQEALSKTVKIVAGGETRSDSVNNGLRATDQDVDIVLIHDGVRPLITKELIEKAVRLAERYEAVVLGVPVKPTIKVVDKTDLFVKQTLNRDELWEIQTPQVFHRKVLLKAFEECRNWNITDEASLVEQMGVKVKVLESDYRNIKITTKEDLIIATALLSAGLDPLI